MPLLLSAAPAAAQTSSASNSAPPTPPDASSPSVAVAAPSSTALPEVIVTGTKTGATRLQRTPAAISVTSGVELRNGQINDIKDLSHLLPDVSYSQAENASEIYIRGIGTSNVSAGSDTDVTTQVDGVYIARPFGQLDQFIDVDRIEVLRGPQGTLYGRNAVGGTINVISKTPSDTLTGDVSVAGGNYGYFQGQSYVSGPIMDTVQGSIAFTYTRHDAYFTNIDPGKPDIGDLEQEGVRGQIRWEPTANIDATTRADVSYTHSNFENFDTVLAPLGASQGPFLSKSIANTIVGSKSKVDLNYPQVENTIDGGISEEVNWHFAPGFTLKSISAFRNSAFRESTDNDATDLNQVYAHFNENDKQYSQEFNLLYNSPSLQAVGGLYFFGDHDRALAAVNVNALTPIGALPVVFEQTHPNIDSFSGAIFGQATYFFTPTISGTVGARYTGETKELHEDFHETLLTTGASPPGFPAIYDETKDYYAFTPKFGLNWQFTPSTLIYGSITDGFKSGGFNYAVVSPAAASFAPERIWSYEVGVKTEMFDRRLRFNVDAFYYDYSNLQVGTIPAPGVVAILNAANATDRGIEVEMVAKPTPSFTFTANFSVLDAKYDSFPASTVPTALLPYVSKAYPLNGSYAVNAAGNYLVNAPKFSGLVAVDYNHDVFNGYKFNAHVDLTYRDRTYLDPSNVLIASQGAYSLLNGQLGIETPDRLWRAEIFGKNLTNKGYLLYVSAAGDTPDGYEGDPRTYGVRLSRHF